MPRNAKEPRNIGLDYTRRELRTLKFGKTICHFWEKCSAIFLANMHDLKFWKKSLSLSLNQLKVDPNAFAQVFSLQEKG